MNNDWKSCLNIVYSTNPDFAYETSDEVQPDTLPAAEQRLKVQLDKRHRNGKSVTLVSGFVGHDDDLRELGKFLKTKCGVGGSAKDGEILIQGDFREKVTALLIDKGYKLTKRIN